MASHHFSLETHVARGDQLPDPQEGDAHHRARCRGMVLGTQRMPLKGLKSPDHKVPEYFMTAEPYSKASSILTSSPKR